MIIIKILILICKSALRLLLIFLKLKLTYEESLKLKDVIGGKC